MSQRRAQSALRARADCANALRDRFEVIEDRSNNTVRFSFDKDPVPYTLSLLKTRGFQGTGTIYQRELDKVASDSVNSILELIAK